MAASPTNLSNQSSKGGNLRPSPANALQRAFVHVRNVSIGCQAKKMRVVQITALSFWLILGVSPHAFLDDGDRQTILRGDSLEFLPG